VLKVFAELNLPQVVYILYLLAMAHLVRVEELLVGDFQPYHNLDLDTSLGGRADIKATSHEHDDFFADLNLNAFNRVLDVVYISVDAGRAAFFLTVTLERDVKLDKLFLLGYLFNHGPLAGLMSIAFILNFLELLSLRVQVENFFEDV